MTPRPSHRYTLRNALPAGLLMVVIAMLALSYVDAVVSGHLAMMVKARDEAVLDAEHLARIAQREFRDRRSNVASDLSVAATNQRLAVLALINAHGVVELAQRLAWRGLPATQVIPGFPVQRFTQTLRGRLADVQELRDTYRVVVMVPYLAEGRAGEFSDEDRGVVYLEYDLRTDVAAVAWDAQRRIWPMLLLTLVFTLALARLLRSRVTEPLARVEEASLQMARQYEFPHVLPETGPREIASLAHSFNLMAVRIRNAQHDIEASRARLAVIFDAAMDAIITVDHRNRVRVVNPAALRMFAAQQADLIGQSIEVFLPTEWHQPNSGFAPLLSGVGLHDTFAGHHALVTGRRLSGETFPAEASVSHIGVDIDKLTIVMLRDVTQRQKAEDAVIALNNSLEQQVEQRTASLTETTLRLAEQQRILQAAHAEQRTIFETLTVGIALLKEQVIVRCNHRLEEIFAYPTDQLAGQRERIWFADDAGYDRCLALASSYMEQGQVYQGHHELVRHDGARFWARMTASHLADANIGTAVLMVIEDMTLQREAEQAIHDAGVRALEASRAKSDFLANMSHEIRTPMNAIIGLTYLVLKSDLTAQQRDHLRKIQSSSQVLLGIVNDILDYSKIEAGKLRVEEIAFSLDKVLDNVAGLLMEKTAAKGLQLHFHVDANVPRWLVGDPLRLGQILTNYADNAVKFTAAGEVSIHIGLREESATRVMLHGAVKDTGIGLTADQLGRLFKSFSQGDSSTTREFGGTGLGLVICKQLAGLMHGEVGAQSTPGVGSTFWFTASLGKAQALDGVPATGGAAHEVATVVAVTGGDAARDREPPLSAIFGARILLVDDNALNREVACELLRDAGLVVHEAHNGKVALELLQQAHYDLVLMDMQMPVMDGLAAARALRKMPGLTALPVVAMTASAMPSDRALCLQAGMNDHVAKPIEPSVLFHVLLKWIQPTGLPVARPMVAPVHQDDIVIPEIAGLDSAAGLRRVRGKKAFYLSLLRRFVQGQVSVVADLRAALYIGNHDEARRIAHNLKGLAGNVGMVSIQACAHDLEKAIESGQSLQMLEVSLNSLERHLEPFIAQLRERLSWPQVPSLDESIDMGLLGAVCRRLASLLREDNLEAVDVLTENEVLLKAAFADAFERIQNEVRNFNSQVALAHLRGAAQSRAIDLAEAGGSL